MSSPKKIPLITRALNIVPFGWYLKQYQCILMLLVTTFFLTESRAQPVVSGDDDPPFFEIDARTRNGNTGFEGALFTPSTPPPGQPGGGPWQMNPAGAPIWNTNGNSYGDIHSFELTYTKATGTTIWKIDFNRDGDFNDPQESVDNVDPTLAGKGFKYVNIRLQGNASGLTASTENFIVNGVNFGTFSSSSETPFSVLFEESTGVFDDITVTGDFSFSGDGGQERPRIWVRLGTANNAPEVEITSPDSGTYFNITDPINIEAIASDNGIIMVVEFYANSILIGEDSLSPYSFSWVGAQPGTYELTAMALDSYDAFAFSLPVNIIMNDPPSCSITSPANGFVFFDPDSIVIDATATDSDDTVSVVEFYVNSIKVGEDSIAPYSFTLYNPLQAIYNLTVKAIDVHGGMTFSNPVVGIVPAPPTCSILFPPDDYIFFDPPVIVNEVLAEDATDAVAFVEFFLNGVSIGVDSFAPYTNSTMVNTPMGMYTLTASATDIYNFTTPSAAVDITVRCIREDIDLNGIVNTNDYLLLLSSFGDLCSGCNEDFNDDGIVNTIDFLRLLTKIGYTCN